MATPHPILNQLNFRFNNEAANNYNLRNKETDLTLPFLKKRIWLEVLQL
jgi:hypothetical protein